MATTIKCNKCGNEIEVTEAIREELQAKILQETQAKHREEIEKLQQEKLTLLATKDRELEEAKRIISETARKEAIERVRKEYDAKIESTKEESQEKEKQNKDLQEQLKNLFKQLRETKAEKEKVEIDYQKKLLEEEDLIKRKAKQEAAEELGLVIAEKNKKLEDAEKQIVEMQRKIQQGSQQLQGEVQELKLEEILKAEFPSDEIKEVPKGVNGADVVQIVYTNSGESCGSIVWESKNTKNWSPSWIQKLKEDQRSLKAELGVLVSKVLPENIQTFGMEDGIFISDMKSVLGLAHLLRLQVLKVYSAYKINEGKASKAEIVYNYLISNEFKQRIEVWVEYFKNRRDEIEKERAYFIKKWEREEKNIIKIIENTAGIYGDLQGLIGNALPKVQSLELSDGTNEK